MNDMICRECFAPIWAEMSSSRLDALPIWWHEHGKTPADYCPHRPIPMRAAVPLTERPKVVW